MNLRYQRLKCTNFLAALSLFQAVSLLIYLNANIVNVGEMGTGLPVLGAFIGISLIVGGVLWLKKRLYVRFHFFIFLLLVLWISFRIIIDLNDIEYLKQVTVATTGGMLLFYIIGCLLGMSYHDVIMNLKRGQFAAVLLIIFLCLLIWMLYNFLQRLHPRLFYLTDVDGAYQRPGNFMSISFISVSFFYFMFCLKLAVRNFSSASFFFWSVIYAGSTVMALMGSQLFGSNSATGVVLGVYLITFVMALLVSKKTLRDSFIKNKLTLPWSKMLVKKLVTTSLVATIIFAGLLFSVLTLTEFDIYSTRLLGFGSDSSSPLMSRIEILVNHGATQLSYAPIFGNINVAYLTTGDSGRYLHSFFPYVMSNLGLVGLGILFALFASIFRQLYRDSKKKDEHSFLCYQYNMISIYSFFVTFFLILFANLTTSVSWVVLWFAIGFVSRPLGFSRFK